MPTLLCDSQTHLKPTLHPHTVKPAMTAAASAVAPASPEAAPTTQTTTTKTITTKTTASPLPTRLRASIDHHRSCQINCNNDACIHNALPPSPTAASVPLHRYRAKLEECAALHRTVEALTTHRDECQRRLATEQEVNVQLRGIIAQLQHELLRSQSREGRVCSSGSVGTGGEGLPCSSPATALASSPDAEATNLETTNDKKSAFASTFCVQQEDEMESAVLPLRAQRKQQVAPPSTKATTPAVPPLSSRSAPPRSRLSAMARCAPMKRAMRTAASTTAPTSPFPAALTAKSEGASATNVENVVAISKIQPCSRSCSSSSLSTSRSISCASSDAPPGREGRAQRYATTAHQRPSGYVSAVDTRSYGRAMSEILQAPLGPWEE